MKSNGTISTPNSSTVPSNGMMEADVNASKRSSEENDDQSSSSLPLEVAKEAKEKKDRSSWVKTLGMRTLRMRKSTDSRSSRLSIPSFSSLERPGKSKKNKSGKNEETSERGDLKLESIINVNDNNSSKVKSEHVKVQNNEVSGASSVNGSTPISKNPNKTQDKDRPTTGENSDKQDPARFLGEGLTFKGKLIGVLEVNGPRGDRICQEALSELKMAVKAAGEHKQKVTVHVALDGLRIRDEKTGDCLYHHQVHKISFIAQDLTDTRAFGYIFGSPDTGHRFFGIKTEKSASQVVIAMRDLFQVVFDLKKKEIERAKQQLEMQQKFLATRAAETAPPSKPEPKFSIAETYIEGACSFRSSSSYVPNRSAPEVDLLNLEVELTSLQEGLDSIHHNLADSGPFRGSTASISSDPMNPMPKRSSVSSSTNTNNTTPIPNAFNSSGDPFGDSFDPYSEGCSGSQASFNLGSSSKIAGQVTSSCNNSALTSPFPADPFAQVDPFPGPKFPGDSEFFNSDPFDSPSGPFSFTFPSDSSSANYGKTSEGRLNSNTSLNASPAPTNISTHSNDVPPQPPSHGSDFSLQKTRDDWTASFEDNFVPDSKAAPGYSLDGKSGVFTELDPLGTGRIKSLVNHPNLVSSVPSSAMPSMSGNNNEDTSKVQMLDGGSIPNSFSTNFNPPNVNSTAAADFDSHFKTKSFDGKSESPPNYSPPPPPRLNSASEFNQPSLNTRGVPFIAPPSSGSPTSRLLKKKSPQILKQMTISESSSSPTTLPKASFRLGKQHTTDMSSLKEEIPNLSPPPRPPHNSGHNVVVSTVKSGSSLTSAVPRPMSGSGSDKSRKISSGSASISGLPPEPPPRPLQTTSISSSSNQAAMQLVSPPPPLPPKKQSLSNTLSHPLNFKPSTMVIDSNKSFSNNSARSSVSESNDLPLPLPMRKTHVVTTDQSSISALSGTGGRYAVPSAAINSTLSSAGGSPSLVKRNSDYLRSTSSIDSVTSNPTVCSKLSMEQALVQVASLSLRDLASKLELPVDKLSCLTIQQLAEKLTEMDLGIKRAAAAVRKESVTSKQSNISDRYEMKFGFDDDFSQSTASAPSNGNVQKSDNGFDRYAVFRELAVEDASGFSIVNNFDSGEINNSEDDEDQSTRTFDKTLTSRDSSSERTLQADDITENSRMKNASFATAVANTMDDVTDVNLSDDQDNGKFPLDDEDDLSSGFMNKPEWATFESNFDDQFATTALVKAEDGNESPWDSDEGENALVVEKAITPASIKSQLNFKPFEKPAELIVVHEEYSKKSHEKEKRHNNREESSPDLIKSPPGQFKRQSSGSSRHSERSSGNGTALGRTSDYSDSGRFPNHSRPRKTSKDYDRWEVEREGSGRFKERDRGDRDYGRSDSRNSYSSISRNKYRNGDSEEDYVLSPVNSASRRSKRPPYSSSRRDKDYDREREVELEDEDDRSFASTYSTSGRKHKRYPSKHHHYHHGGRPIRRGDKTTSPERYSNQESDDESFEDEPRKRDRDYYAREREYYERHHRPRPSSGTGSIKRHSRDSPRHTDSYYRRGDRRGRHRDDEELDEREGSEYSGEEGRRGHSYYGYGSHRRPKPTKRYHKDQREREHRGHYYTNSPSWDSESCPEGEKESNSKAEKQPSSRRPTSGKDRNNEEERRYSRGGSPEFSKRYNEGSGRRASGSGSARRYQSELALNSKTNDSQKLSAFNFDDDFGASSLPPVDTFNQEDHQQPLSSMYSPTKPKERSRNNNNGNQTESVFSSIPSSKVKNTTDCKSVESTKDSSQPNSPFENDFAATTEEEGLKSELIKNGNDEEKDIIAWEDDDDKEGQLIEPLTNNEESCTTESTKRASENKIESVTKNYINLNSSSEFKTAEGLLIEDDSVNANGGESNPDIFPPANESKAFNFTGRRLESIKSEEEKSNDDSHSHSASESAVQMKKSDSFNIFKQRSDDPFADDDFFA